MRQNFLMLMETCQHILLLEVHMEDLYVFNANGEMPTQYLIEKSYGRFL